MERNEIGSPFPLCIIALFQNFRLIILRQTIKIKGKWEQLAQ
jgi:hypothetical protein